MAANLRLVQNSNWFEKDTAVSDAPVSKSVRELMLMPVANFAEEDVTGASYKMLAIVLCAHLLILAGIFMTRPASPVSEKIMTPMTVSLVNAPALEEPQVTPKQPEVVETPKKQQPKPKPTPELSKLPVKELPISKAVVSQPAELPAMAEHSASENSVKTEQPLHVAEAPAKVEAAPEPVIEPPRFGAAYLNNPPPTYPAMSRRSGEQGRVLLRVLVSESGLAESVQLDSSSGYEKLDRAAIEAVKKWSFIPAKRSNQPISAYVLVPVKFSLSS